MSDPNLQFIIGKEQHALSYPMILCWASLKQVFTIRTLYFTLSAAGILTVIGIAVYFSFKRQSSSQKEK